VQVDFVVLQMLHLQVQLRSILVDSFQGLRALIRPVRQVLGGRQRLQLVNTE
jgi:hypothetical protein